MDEEEIKTRLADLENYLNQRWQGLSDNFIDRLLAKIEHEKLSAKLKELHGKDER